MDRLSLIVAGLIAAGPIMVLIGCYRRYAAKRAGEKKQGRHSRLYIFS